MGTRFVVLAEVKEKLKDGTEDSLCLQNGIYLHPHGENEPGVRFIRRGADGKMKAQRGQANCLSIKIIKELTNQAERHPIIATNLLDIAEILDPTLRRSNL